MLNYELRHCEYGPIFPWLDTSKQCIYYTATIHENHYYCLINFNAKLRKLFRWLILTDYQIDPATILNNYLSILK